MSGASGIRLQILLQENLNYVYLNTPLSGFLQGEVSTHQY